MKLKIEKKKTDNDTTRLKLTGEMTVYSSPKLKDLLLGELKSCRHIKLDLDGVKEADTSGFQLLLFIKRESEAAGKKFSVTGINGRLESIVSLYRETF